jgi:Xaa-Pro aminopeptidase
MELIYMSTLLDIPAQRVNETASHDLMAAITVMREIKTEEEIAVMERAFEVGYKMHTTAMRMCREGVIEREIIGAINGIAMQHGWGWSFYSHVTQHGEILHNFGCDYPLENGKLLLVDAGAELAGGYCSDHTRTYPVSGKFTTKQREIYEIVLRAHDHVLDIARPMRYMDLHNASLLSMARDLTDLGLLKGNPEEAVAAGAMFMLMPHGLGHGMGIDVHDCEAIGERGNVYNFDFSRFAPRVAELACCTYRSTWQLRPGVVMSDEPGIYFIPALIEQWKKEGKCKEFINYDRLADYYDFGGIRIEDDLLITEDGCRCIGGDKHIPITVEELEAVVGRD